MRTATVHIPDNCPLCGHKSVTPAADGSGYRCGQPPCGWGIFTAPPEQAKALEEKPHKFSSTQFNLEMAGYNRTQGPPIPKLQRMQDKIDDSDLADDGKEDTFHVTVKYGLHTNDAGQVRQVVEKFGSVSAKLGKTSLFQSPDYDVVKVDVESDDLQRLNKLISSSLECTDTHPKYIPHVTLAYVKSGAGKKYEGMTDVDGLQVILTELIFSDTNKQKTGIEIASYPSVEKTMSAYQGGLGAELVAPPKFMGPAPKKVKALKSKYKRLSEYKVGDRVTLQSSPIVYVLREQLGGGAWRAITYDKLESGLTYLVHERYMKPYYEQKSSHSNPEDQNQVDQLAVETKSWWGSSIPKNIAIKGGFSGRKKDKLGRQRCYSGGKPVPCVPAPQAPGVGRRIGGAIGGTVGALTGTGLGSAVGMAVASSGRGKEGEGAIIDKLKTPRSPRERAIWQAGGAIAGGIGGAVSGGLEGHKIGGYVGEKLEQGVRGAGHILSAPFRKKSLGLSLRDHHKSIGGKIGAAVGGVVGAGVGLTGAAAAAHGVTPRPRSYGILKSPAWTAGAVGVGAAGAAAGAHVGSKVGEAVEHGVRKVASHFTGKPATPKSLDMEGKGGFTGRRKDKLKRERCYNQGKLVPCGQGEAGKQKPTDKKGEEKKGGTLKKIINVGSGLAVVAGIVAYVYINDAMRKKRAREVVAGAREWGDVGQATVEEARAQLERIKKERIEERAKEVEKIKNNPNDPIRAGFERMQFHAEERQALREAEVTDVKQLISGGVDENYVVTLADGGKGLWKPVKGEGVGIREGASPGTGFRRAVAASAVADLLGFDDLVPTTEFRELNREPGSIQHFVNNAPMAFELPEQHMYDGDEDAARASVYDYIVGHMDRHAANWLIDGGKLVLIDNGLSFPDKRQTGYGAKMFEEFAKDKNLPMPDISRIQGKWPQMEKLLKECGLKPTSIAYTKARYDTVTSGRYQKVKDLPKMYKLDFEGADAGRGAPSPDNEAHSTGEE